ncbi:MAG: hypothetical protein ACOYM0_01200 [Bacteroidales bacterium]
MNFKIKAGKRTSDNTCKMRMVSGRTLRFRFKLNASCQYDHERIINGWNRVFGVSPIFSKGSCDLLFMQDRDQLTLAMQVTYKTSSSCFNTSILKRMITVCPGVWHWCEISYFKNSFGHWVYYMRFDHENIFDPPFWWQMEAPASFIPGMFLRHPALGGRYILDDDIDMDIELIK